MAAEVAPEARSNEAVDDEAPEAHVAQAVAIQAVVKVDEKATQAEMTTDQDWLKRNNESLPRGMHLIKPPYWCTQS